MANTTIFIKKTKQNIDKEKLNIILIFYLESVKGNANQWKNWFARDTLIVVPLTRAGGEDSNIVGRCFAFIILLH